MPRTEIAKQLGRERKHELQKELRQRARELTSPSIGRMLRCEERELREQEKCELREERKLEQEE